MSDSVDFIDTNIFVYAFDETDMVKSKRARELLANFSGAKTGCISVQVIQEFCNVALKKSVVPLRPGDLRKVVRELLVPLLVRWPDESFYLRVIDTFERHSLEFYDASIVQAAIDAHCRVLYTEDMQAGANYSGVKVVNPFI